MFTERTNLGFAYSIQAQKRILEDPEKIAVKMLVFKRLQ